MIHLITPENRHFYRYELFRFYRGRFRAFYVKNKWKLKVKEGLEKDQFDNEHAYYLVYVNDYGDVAGGVRLIPTCYPHLFSEVFPAFAPEGSYERSKVTWEATRLFVDDHLKIGERDKNIERKAVCEILIAMNQLALSWGIEKIVALMDCRTERLYKILGWPLTRLTEPSELEGKTVVSGYWTPSNEAIKRLKKKASIRGITLWGGFPLKSPIVKR